MVTISATYGAGGSVIGPRVARSLGVPFLDRAIPVAVSTQLAVDLEQALAHDDRAQTGVGRLLEMFAGLPAPVGPAPPETPTDERVYVQETERAIHAHASGGAVLLGRAGAVVLASHPSALHVRLDGPAAKRVGQAVRRGSFDEAQARKRARDADGARTAYVKHFYHRNPADPSLYHLILDSTAIDWGTCTELIVTGAHARAAAAPSTDEGA